jgi:hypothetical protein
MNENITPEHLAEFRRWFVEKWEAWEFTYRHRSAGPLNFSALNLRRLLKQTARLYIAIKADAEIDTTADWVKDAWISFLLRPKNASAPVKYDQAYLTQIEPFLAPRFLAGHSFTVKPNARESGPIPAQETASPVLAVHTQKIKVCEK